MTEIKKTNRMSATDRISALERTVIDLGKKTDDLRSSLVDALDELENSQRNFIALSRRVKAMLDVSEGKEGLSNESVNKYLMEEAVDNLKSQVAHLVKAGALVKAEEVSDGGFVVFRILNDKSEEIDARCQTLLSDLPEGIRASMLGKKAGDIVKDTDNLFEITEVYSLSKPNPQP